MPRGRIVARCLCDCKPVVDMPPMIRRNIAWVDARRFDGVYSQEYALDLRPSRDRKQYVAAWVHTGECCEWLARTHASNDVEQRADGAVFVRRPADEGEKLAFIEGQVAPPPVYDRVGNWRAKAQPMLLLTPKPIELDMGLQRGNRRLLGWKLRGAVHVPDYRRTGGV